MSRFTINVSFSEEQMEELKEYIRECFKQLEEIIGGNSND